MHRRQTNLFLAVTHNRKLESDGIQHVIDMVEPSKVLLPDLHIRMEGGDVMPWDGKIYVGYSKEEDFNKYIVSRTNEAGVDYLRQTFPNWEVVPFELKSPTKIPMTTPFTSTVVFSLLEKEKSSCIRKGLRIQMTLTAL